jgi:hypothetical protein
MVRKYRKRTTPSTKFLQSDCSLDLRFSRRWPKSNVFWYVTPCGLAEVYLRFRGTSHRQGGMSLYFLLVSCIAYSSTLKMEAVCSTVVNFYPTTRRHIPDYSLWSFFHGHCIVS